MRLGQWGCVENELKMGVNLKAEVFLMELCELFSVSPREFHGPSSEAFYTE